MMVRPLAFVMFTAVAASAMLACSGASTTLPEGDANGKADNKEQGEIVGTPKKAEPKKGTTPVVDTGNDPAPATCSLKQVDFGAGACGTCIKGSCCGEWTACEKNPDCLPLFVCAQKCAGDQPCIKDCVAMYPTGGEPLVAATSCTKEKCDAKCQ